jgi:hypothetical protein
MDQARALGTREWAISGGEPLLREDFTEIFDYATCKARTYSLNTNGTLITPEIARLLKRKGNKMVAVYGSTAEVYEHVTRNPGGFDALLQGLNYLKEAGVGFTMQLIPMRDNWDQWDQMKEFAQSWSKHWRVGAPWLFMTACGDPARNAEIERQRLDPADVVELDPPDMSCGQSVGVNMAIEHVEARADRSIGLASERPDFELRSLSSYARCVEARREFYVSPQGRMSFCALAGDSSQQFELRSSVCTARASASGGPVASQVGIVPDGVAIGWETFIPTLGDGGLLSPQRAECLTCELRSDCRRCDAHGYLEKGRHYAKVDYLCEVARSTREFRKRWLSDHRRYYEIAGITLQVDSDLVITDTTFAQKFDWFRVDGPGDDNVVIRHHFGLPEAREEDKGVKVYHKIPWAVYRKGKSWIYEGIYEEVPPRSNDPETLSIAVFADDHSRGEIYNQEDKRRVWAKGSLGSLTMFPTDQIVLARLLADREGCIVHSGGLIVDGQGLLFVGQSGMGKSTTMEMIRGRLGCRAEILCDDRNIIRRWPQGFRVHGTWSHGDIPDVSSASAPLRAILFLQQDTQNLVESLHDPMEVWGRMLPRLVRPLVTADWWHKELDLLAQVVDGVPCYVMRFDKSGAVVSQVECLLQ